MRDRISRPCSCLVSLSLAFAIAIPLGDAPSPACRTHYCAAPACSLLTRLETKPAHRERLSLGLSHSLRLYFKTAVGWEVAEPATRCVSRAPGARRALRRGLRSGLRSDLSSELRTGSRAKLQLVLATHGDACPGAVACCATGCTLLRSRKGQRTTSRTKYQ